MPQPPTSDAQFDSQFDGPSDNTSSVPSGAMLDASLDIDDDAFDGDGPPTSELQTRPANTPKFIFAQRGLIAPLLVLIPILIAQAVTSYGALPQPGRDATGLRADQLSGALDPNVAPWWELTALPRVGETTAKRIVAFRESQAEHSPDQPVFASANDLEQVPGIGPKTVARLSPYLFFE